MMTSTNRWMTITEPMKLHNHVAKDLAKSHGKNQVVILAWDVNAGLDWAAAGASATDSNIAKAVARRLAKEYRLKNKTGRN